MPDVFVVRSDRYLETMTRSATRRKQKDRRKEARLDTKGPVVDLRRSIKGAGMYVCECRYVAE